MTAMISLAAVMSKRVVRSVLVPALTTTLRSARSFTSTARDQVTLSGVRPDAPPKCRSLSIMAASRLCAAVMACRSPVKCRLMSLAGSTWALPPPVPPPLMPNTGPREGSRRHSAVRWPKRRSPSARPTLTVVLPSPAFVGVMALTSTSLPVAGAVRFPAASSTFALVLPKGSTCCGTMPRSAATSEIGRNTKGFVCAGVRSGGGCRSGTNVSAIVIAA